MSEPPSKRRKTSGAKRGGTKTKKKQSDTDDSAYIDELDTTVDIPTQLVQWLRRTQRLLPTQCKTDPLLAKVLIYTINYLCVFDPDLSRQDYSRQPGRPRTPCC